MYGNNSYAFTYDDEGRRISKTENGVVTRYYYDGDLLVCEQSAAETIFYIYDSHGLPIGMQYRASTYSTGVYDVYWFERNTQGDIGALYNSSGVKFVSDFYIAWGKLVYMSYHNGGNTSIATKNPFRYRGYYYDQDLEMYYLQTRYYDPMTCRFISADTSDVLTATPDALTDKNLFAYCDNNPVMRTDYDGRFWLTTLVKAVVGAVVNVTTTFIAAKITGQDYTLTDVGVNAAAGAASAFGVGGAVLGGVICGVYTGVSAAQNGATFGEAVLAGAVTGFATTMSISNIAAATTNFGNKASEIAVAAFGDLVFGMGGNSIAAAVSASINNKARARQPRNELLLGGR